MQLNRVHEESLPLKQVVIVRSTKLLESASNWLFKGMTHWSNAQSAIYYLEPNGHAYVLIQNFFIEVLVFFQFRNLEHSVFLAQQIFYVIIISINTCTNDTFQRQKSASQTKSPFDRNYVAHQHTWCIHIHDHWLMGMQG